ncbi:MAG: c-type cytochrome [Verrucomicrobiaceae bacterium]|nr:MAG: c-type cytochrome [Verrucomicrobiaceae bacterium]
MIASRSPEDRWTRAAILSSAAGVEKEVLLALLTNGSNPDFALLHDLAQLIGKRTATKGRTATLAELLNIPRVAENALLALVSGFANSPGGLPDGISDSRLSEVIRHAAQTAAKEGPAEVRLFAIDLLGFTSFDVAGEALIAALEAPHPPLQAAAVRALARLKEPQSAEALLDSHRWARLAPSVREAILTAVASRPQLIQILLAAIEERALPVSTVDSLRRQQFLKHANTEIRTRAAKLFSAPAEGDRVRAFENSKAALALSPQPANGREVFRRACAACHRIEREGAAVGPDLFDIRNQSKESILLHIVVPEHEIAPGFSAYVLEMKDGRTLSGVIASETADNITIRQPGGQEETLSRAQVAHLTASPVSLMPQGLEKAITAQEMADLIAYLRGEQ